MHRVAGDPLKKRPRFAPAALIGERAAWVQGAARGWMDRVSGFAAYGKAGPPREAQIRHGVQQHARVRVSGRREQVTSGHFHETSEVHDSDASPCGAPPRDYG